MLSVPAAGALNAASKKATKLKNRQGNCWTLDDFTHYYRRRRRYQTRHSLSEGLFFTAWGRRPSRRSTDGRESEKKLKYKYIYLCAKIQGEQKKNKATDRQALIYFRLRWRDDEGTCRAIHIKKSNRRRNSMHPSADHLKSIYNIYTTPVGPQNAYSENKTKQQQTKCCLPQCCTFKPPAFH